MREELESVLARAGGKMARVQRVLLLNLAYFTVVLLSHLYLRLKGNVSYTGGYYSEPEGTVCGELEEYLDQY